MNPRAAFDGYTISSRARYDHFDTTPSSIGGVEYTLRSITALMIISEFWTKSREKYLFFGKKSRRKPDPLAHFHTPHEIPREGSRFLESSRDMHLITAAVFQPSPVLRLQLRFWTVWAAPKGDGTEVLTKYRTR